MKLPNDFDLEPRVVCPVVRHYVLNSWELVQSRVFRIVVNFTQIPPNPRHIDFSVFTQTTSTAATLVRRRIDLSTDHASTLEHKIFQPI